MPEAQADRRVSSSHIRRAKIDEEQSGKFDIKPVKEGGAGKTKAK